jgi:DNA polymerase V
MSYVSGAARKLRKQGSLAGSLLVFVMTNKYSGGPQYVNYKIIRLPVPSNQTAELIHYAVIALKHLFREGYKYKKSGVIVSDLIPSGGLQTAMWDEKQRSKAIKLLRVIDKINEKAGADTLKFAIEGSEKTWRMRQENLSPHYTTRWKDILVVDIDKA